MMNGDSKDTSTQKEATFNLEDVPKLTEFYGALIIGPSGSGKTTLC